MTSPPRYYPAVPRWPLQHLTIRAVLILGFGVTLGLWLLTGAEFARRLTDVEQRSTEVSRRYVQAQDLLAEVRTRVLTAAVLVRDALLDAEAETQAGHRQQVHQMLLDAGSALEQYDPALDPAREHAAVADLQQQLGTFRDEMLILVQTPGRPSAREVRGLLNREVVPRRNAILAATEEIQAANRRAFIAQQQATAAEYAVAERRRWQGLGLALLAGLGVAVLATVYAGRLERRLVTQLQKDAESTRRLQELSGKLITAQEAERRRIARELHDEIGQVLSAVKVELVLAQRAMDNGQPQARLLDRVQAIADEALHSVRDLSRLLHPAQLDHLGLSDAVAWYIRDFSTRFGIPVEFTHEGIDRFSPDVEVAVYRIIQEALTNVARHASPSRVRVHLAARDGVLEVTVEDDGVGFAAPGAAAGPPSGLGLIGMRERATVLHGVVDVASAPGSGTRVTARLPARRPVETADV